ncbi:hypothetical protein PENTCL1PPCAC_19352, partial [Pristionchus entomophagus]
IALVAFLVGAVAATIAEFEADFPQPDDLFLYTIERSRREDASTTTTTTLAPAETTTTTAAVTTTALPSTTTSATTIAPIAVTTTALPSTLAPITVTSLPVNLFQQQPGVLTIPAGTGLTYNTGLQLNNLGWAGQPYRYEPQLGLRTFPTGGYRFTHALVAPAAPAALARNYAPSQFAPLSPYSAPTFGAAPYYGAWPDVGKRLW